MSKFRDRAVELGMRYSFTDAGQREHAINGIEAALLAVEGETCEKIATYIDGINERAWGKMDEISSKIRAYAKDGSHFCQAWECTGDSRCVNAKVNK